LAGIRNFLFGSDTYDALHVRIGALLEPYKKLVGDMRKAGVEFLAGTDSSGWNPVFPGFGLHEELALLVESGLTPMEALQSATRNPARYFNKLGEMGTIEVKKAADLVLLNADPPRHSQYAESRSGRYARALLFAKRFECDVDAGAVITDQSLRHQIACPLGGTDFSLWAV
jgi:predicted amidohydrolase YtcJ